MTNVIKAYIQKAYEKIRERIARRKTRRHYQCIQKVYEKMRELLALCEETDRYYTLPEGSKEQDISEYLENRLKDIRQEINASLSDPQICEQLTQIADETESFVMGCEIPGVVERWRRINPDILFFDCAFDLVEKCPDDYRQFCSGNVSAYYPDERAVAERKKYFQAAMEKYGGKDISDVEDKAFQDELLRTLELVFRNDFGDK